MKIDTTTSLIISTYNNPAFLNLSLLSLKNQTVLPAEVIIADDGSTIETKQLIDSFRSRLPIPIIHVWQEDEGFRLAQIRNLAIAASTKEYIIQIDGDIIMEKHFIEDHLYHRKPKGLLQGSRVLVKERLTKELIATQKTNLFWLTPGIGHRENAIRSKKISNYLSIRYRNKYPIYYARGCNMSYWRDDFIKVNGFNQDFVGWGHEDSEFTLRMLNSGCQKYYIKFHCVAFHLYHPEASKKDAGGNQEIMQKQLDEKSQLCERGVNEYKDTFQDFIL